MTLFEYEEGLDIAAKDPPFYALIQAAMRKADTENPETLKGGAGQKYGKSYVHDTMHPAVYYQKS